MKNVKNLNPRTYQRLTKMAKQVYGKTLSKLNAAESYYLQNYKVINRKYQEINPIIDSSKPNATYGNYWKTRVEMTRFSKKKGVMNWKTATEKVVMSNFLTPEEIRSKFNLFSTIKEDYEKTYKAIKEHLTGGKKTPFKDIFGKFSSFEKSTLVANEINWNKTLKRFTFESKTEADYYVNKKDNKIYKIDKQFQIVVDNSPEDIYLKEIVQNVPEGWIHIKKVTNKVIERAKKYVID